MKELTIPTSSRTELIDITSMVQDAVGDEGLESGIVVVYCPHTTGAITINEGADPAVKRDILAVINRVIPWDFDYRHMEGNSPAHIKTSLFGPSVQVIVERGRLQLGTWQKIFFCEFDGPRRRKVWIKTIADRG
jgi:secondary thiamine-phosphate synthase enzyme